MITKIEDIRTRKPVKRVRTNMRTGLPVYDDYYRLIKQDGIHLGDIRPPGRPYPYCRPLGRPYPY